MEIKTKREYLELIPPLSRTEFDELKRSIKEQKQLVPVIVNKKNEILDGHHRWKACKELGIAIDFYVSKLDNDLDEKEFIIEVNLKRRHLNEFQRGELGLALEKIEAARAKLRHEATKFTTSKAKEAINKRWHKPIAPVKVEADAKKPNTRTSQVIADRVHVSHATIERIKKIKEKGSPEQIRALTEGSVGIRKVFSQIKREEKRDELIAAARERLRDMPSGAMFVKSTTKTVDVNQLLNPPIHLFNKDFRQITEAEIPRNSIDLIFTDPPYTQESLPLYAALASAAVAWLKEGGSLVTYAPTYALPQVLNSMNNTMLHYWWQFVVKHSGGRTRMHKYRLWVRYKPLLWFVKGPVDSPPANMIDDVDDFIVSKPPDENKATHDWEQSTVEASYIIQNLSVEGQTVLDPFMGTGTTGLAAIRLKREFFGCDVNEISYVTAKDRFNREKR